VIDVLWDWWENALITPDMESLKWFDPAVGDGRLLKRPSDAGCPTIGWDIRNVVDEERYKDRNVSGICDFMRVDSLSVDWPSDANVIMNPPFGTRSNDLSSAFLRKAAEHRDKNDVWCAALMLTSCLQAMKRLDIPMPEFRVDLTWRPRFESTKAMSGGYFKDFSWFIYAPKIAKSMIDAIRCVVSSNKDSSIAFRVTRVTDGIQRDRDRQAKDSCEEQGLA